MLIRYFETHEKKQEDPMGVIQGKIPIGKFWLGVALLLSLLLVALSLIHI